MGNNYKFLGASSILHLSNEVFFHLKIEAFRDIYWDQNVKFLFIFCCSLSLTLFPLFSSFFRLVYFYLLLFIFKVEESLMWQLANPGGTKEECVLWLTEAFSKISTSK